MSGPQKVGRTRDDMISVCKRCRYGIFANRTPYTWQIRPIPGYVHIACLPGTVGEQAR